MTARFTLHGGAYCWAHDASIPYGLRGMAWTMHGRTEAEGRVNAPPAYNVGRDIAHDDIAPWTFAT